MGESESRASRSGWIPSKIERAEILGSQGVDGPLLTYLTRLVNEVSSVEFGDPSEYLNASGINVMGTADLTDVWVMPMVQEIQMSSVSVSSPKANVPVPLERVIFESAGRARVLLGGPGAGKSTVCRYIAARLGKEAIASQGQADVVPLIVPSRVLEEVPGRDFDDALVSAAVEAMSGIPNRNRPAVVEALLDVLDKAYILLDGLDEAPSDHSESDARMTRQEILLAAKRFTEEHPDARCLVTSREADFIFEENLYRVFPACFLLDKFSRPQVEQSIRLWHGAAARMAGELGISLPNWTQREEALQDLVRADPDLGALAEVPLLLNLMQLVFRTEDDFPKNVSQLAMRALMFLLIDSPHRKLVEPGRLRDLLSGENAELLLNGLRRLAYDATTGIVRGAQAAFSPGDMYDALDDEITHKSNTQQGLWKADDISLLTRHLRGGHGILVQSGLRRYEFSHNVFREVLAGQRLDRVGLDELKAKAVDERWILPLRYWAGWRAGKIESAGLVSTIARELLDYSQQLSGVARSVAILCVSEMVTELTRPGSALKGWTSVTILKNDVVGLMIAMLNSPDLGIRLRIRVGDLLSGLGDPRLASLETAPRQWVDSLIAIPAATGIVIGRDKPHTVQRDKYTRSAGRTADEHGFRGLPHRDVSGDEPRL